MAVEVARSGSRLLPIARLAAVVPARRPAPRRDRRRHRVGARDPEGARLRRDRPGADPERALRGRRRRAALRACSAPPARSPPGPARRWPRSRPAPSCSPACRRGSQTAELVAAITLVTAAAVPGRGRVQDGLAVAPALQAGHHRLPVRRGDRRGRRRAAEADRHRRATGTNSWRQFGSWLRGLDDLHWLTLAVGFAALALVIGLHLARAEGARRARARRHRPGRRRGCSTSPATAWPPSGTSPAACRRRSCPPPICSSDHAGDDRDRRGRPVPRRLLPDGRRWPHVRRPPPLPHPTSTRRWWPRASATPAPACSRGCRCRPACRPAR